MHYDQSFNSHTIAKLLRKSDFFDDRSLHIDSYKTEIIDGAVASAQSEFNNSNPLVSFRLQRKTVYKFRSLKDELVARKLYRNLQHITQIKQQSRDLIVTNLAHLLSEGVPYRLYRLDIKSFYESFSTTDVIEKIKSLNKLSPLSKCLLEALMSQYVTFGGAGVPRGLALGALLSDLMMAEFDASLARQPNVYFTARYVDDITFITNAEECPRTFMNLIKNFLPNGLAFSDTKKDILTVDKRVTPAKIPSELIKFSYLGYEFCVSEPTKVKDVRQGNHPRLVSIDIAPKKIKRIKTKIVRSFLSYSKDRNFQLLLRRIKYLTSNYSIKDYKKNSYKLAGIYHNYPQITLTTATGLKKLDGFLRDAIRSTTGRVFSACLPTLTSADRRLLLKCSFSHGHRKKVFLHFHPREIRLIEKCWIYYSQKTQ